MDKTDTLKKQIELLKLIALTTNEQAEEAIAVIKTAMQELRHLEGFHACESCEATKHDSELFVRQENEGYYCSSCADRWTKHFPKLGYRPLRHVISNEEKE